jgi:hypothetical protein
MASTQSGKIDPAYPSSGTAMDSTCCSTMAANSAPMTSGAHKHTGGMSQGHPSMSSGEPASQGPITQGRHPAPQAMNKQAVARTPNKMSQVEGSPAEERSESPSYERMEKRKGID